MPNKGKLRWFLSYQAPAIVWALLIFILSSIPKLPLPELDLDFKDKIAHTVAYAILGYLTARALFYQSRFPGWRKKFLLFAILLGIVYGISDEIHQYFVPGRVADVGDLIADAGLPWGGPYPSIEKVRKKKSFLKLVIGKSV
jgi:VanZ family protein